MIYRIKKRGYYTVIANEFLRDASMPLSVRGLFAVMLSRPDNWDFSEFALAKELRMPSSEVCALLESLERKGYAKRRKGRYGTVWDLYEAPFTSAIPSDAALRRDPPKRSVPKTDDYGLTYGELALRSIEQAKEARKAAEADAANGK